MSERPIAPTSFIESQQITSTDPTGDESASHSVVEWINQRPKTVLIALSALYFAVALAQSWIKLLWFDEFITFYIARLNGAAEIWRALVAGADPNPPMMHLFAMWSMRLFGEGQVAVRLPAVLASWVGLLCLYAFLRRRVPVSYAAGGVLFFMATGAFGYSYEARSYALTLSFAMLSILAWRWTAEGSHQRAASVLLGVSLAAGISSNYFAVLAMFPVAVGEAVRTFERRKVDQKVWLALACGAMPLLVYMPMIDFAIAKFRPYAFNRIELNGALHPYVVDPIVWPTIAFLGAGAVILMVRRGRDVENERRILPRPELAAVIVLMAYPLIAYIIANIKGGMMSPRFVLPVTYGFGIAVTVMCFKLFRNNPKATLWFVALLCVWFAGREAIETYLYVGQRKALFRVRDSLPPEKTIAVSDGLLVLPLYFYSSPDVAKRLVLPLDLDAIHRYKHEDSAEQNLWAGRGGIFPVPVVGMAELERADESAVIISTGENWLLHAFVAEGTPVRKLPVELDSRRLRTLSYGSLFYYEFGGLHATLAERPGSKRKTQ